MAENPPKAAEQINLFFPIKESGVELHSVTMRRPKVRDQMKADTGPGTQAQKEVNLFADLCGLAPDTLKELDMADYRKLQKAFDVFLQTQE